MRIRCPNCGRDGVLPAGVATPALVRCPQCDHKFQPVAAGPSDDEVTTVGPGSVREPAPAGAFVFCRRCGTRNPENNYQCSNCGTHLHDEMMPIAPGSDPSMGGMIPYRNSNALVAYYMGIFSLIPCVGLPLGVLAVIFGILGLKHAGRHPEAKGQAHAWIGVILGGLCAFANLALMVVPFIIAAARS